MVRMQRPGTEKWRQYDDFGESQAENWVLADVPHPFYDTGEFVKDGKTRGST